MEHEAIFNKINKIQILMHKLNYEVNLNNWNKYAYQPIKLSFGHTKISKIDIGDSELGLWPGLIVLDKELKRFQITLELFINISFKKSIGEVLNSKLREKNGHILTFEFIKLSTSWLNEVINKVFEWMGISGENFSHRLNHEFDIIAKKREWKIVLPH